MDFRCLTAPFKERREKEKKTVAELEKAIFKKTTFARDVLHRLQNINENAYKTTPVSSDSRRDF